MRYKDVPYQAASGEQRRPPLNTHHICIHCMSEKSQPGGSCPSCGKKNEHYSPASHHLPPLTTLNNGKYLLGRVISEDASSINYMALDISLRMPVSVKELFLHDICRRTQDYNVSVQSSSSQLFAENRRRFKLDAQLLAKFNEAGIEGVINVKEFFESNSTSYIVTEHLSGIALKNYVQQKGAFDVTNTLNIIQTVGKTLSHMHKMGYAHTAVGPDSIILTAGNKVRLTSFGSAVKLNAPQNDNSITFVRDYAPPEQYAMIPIIGPWTDIYALAATMRFCLTGAAPANYSERQAGVSLPPLSECGVKLKTKQEAAINTAMDLDYEKRQKSVDEFLQVFQTRSSAAIKIAVAAVVCVVLTAVVTTMLLPKPNPGGTEISANYSVGDTVPMPLGTYIIENYADSSYIMGIDSGFGDNGARLVLKKFEQANRNRVMVTGVQATEGFFNLQIAHTNSYLQANNTSQIGSPIIQNTQIMESGTEQWYFVYCGTENGKDYFMIKNAAGSVIAPKEGRMQAGNDLVLAQPNDANPSQLWCLNWNPKDTSEPSVRVYQTGEIIGNLSGTTVTFTSTSDNDACIAVSSYEGLEIPELIVWEDVNGKSQQFRFEKAGEHRYRIYPIMQDGGLDKCLEYNNATGRIIVSDVNNSNNQLFRVRYAGYNTYMVQTYDESVLTFSAREDGSTNGVAVKALPYESVADRSYVTWYLREIK